MKRTELQRFWSKVHIPPSPCWTWSATRNERGYGKFSRDGEAVKVGAHRYAYEMAYGPVPDGHVVRHTCDNPSCVNPAHLIDGTQADNMRDAIDRKRIATGAKNGRTKITEEDVAYIRSNPRGMTLKLMAERFGMSQAAIHYIRRGRSWKGVEKGLQVHMNQETTTSQEANSLKNMVGAEGIEPPTYPV